MRKFSVAVVSVVLAAVVAACGGSDDKQTGDKAATSGKLEGSISVWIMDPGSPKIQGVVKQYGTDFEAVLVSSVAWRTHHAAHAVGAALTLGGWGLVRATQAARSRASLASRRVAPGTALSEHRDGAGTGRAAA